MEDDEEEAEKELEGRHNGGHMPPGVLAFVREEKQEKRRTTVRGTETRLVRRRETKIM